LESRARLDVAGQEAHDRVGARAECPDELADSRHELDRVPVAHDCLELADIRLEAVAETRLDRLARDPGGGQNVPDDARVGLAAEVVDVERAGGPVGPLECLPEGGASRAARDQQCAVDVEQEEPHASAARGAARGRASGSRSSTRAISRSRSSRSRTTSAGPSSRARSAATPIPTIAGRFSVPARYPPSCPPPRIWGASLTPARAHRAPAPGGP